MNQLPLDFPTDDEAVTCPRCSGSGREPREYGYVVWVRGVKWTERDCCRLCVGSGTVAFGLSVSYKDGSLKWRAKERGYFAAKERRERERDRERADAYDDWQYSAED